MLGLARNDGREMVLLRCQDLRHFVKLEEVHEKKEESEEVADQDELEATPLDKAVNTSLHEQWEDMYHFQLHPSNEFPSQLLHAMYKKLKNRRGEAEYVEGVHTLAYSGIEGPAVCDCR